MSLSLKLEPKTGAFQGHQIDTGQLLNNDPPSAPFGYLLWNPQDGLAGRTGLVNTSLEWHKKLQSNSGNILPIGVGSVHLAVSCALPSFVLWLTPAAEVPWNLQTTQVGTMVGAHKLVRNPRDQIIQYTLIYHPSMCPV